MAFKVTWHPVLQALALKDYLPDYAENVIMVCVNPRPEFLAERISLMAEYQRRALEVQVAAQKVENSQHEDRQKAELLGQSFTSWIESTFLPGMRDWFVRLWSFGDDKWNVEDLEQIEKTDEHLAVWLKMRSLEMIDEHRAGIKKA